MTTMSTAAAPNKPVVHFGVDVGGTISMLDANSLADDATRQRLQTMGTTSRVGLHLHVNTIDVCIIMMHQVSNLQRECERRRSRAQRRAHGCEHVAAIADERQDRLSTEVASNQTLKSTIINKS